jgi:hypothetical protein
MRYSPLTSLQPKFPVMLAKFPGQKWKQLLALCMEKIPVHSEEISDLQCFVCHVTAGAWSSQCHVANRTLTGPCV